MAAAAANGSVRVSSTIIAFPIISLHTSGQVKREAHFTTAACLIRFTSVMCVHL